MLFAVIPRSSLLSLSLSLLSLTTLSVYLFLTLQLKIPLPRATPFNASPMISTTGPERPLSASHSPPYSPAQTQSIPLSSSSSSSSPPSSSKNNSNVPAVILPPRSGLSSPSSSSALTPLPASETPNPDQSPIPLDNPPLSPASFASSSSSLVDEGSIPVGPRDLDR